MTKLDQLLEQLLFNGIEIPFDFGSTSKSSHQAILACVKSVGQGKMRLFFPILVGLLKKILHGNR
jgi:hypothetical protein